MKKIITLTHRLCGKLFNELSENGIVTYISLKALYNKNMEEQWLSINAINRVLKPKKELTNALQKEAIKIGLKELESHGYIKIIKDIKSEYHLDMSGLYVENEETIKEEIENTFDSGTHLEDRTYTNYFTTFDLNTFINVYEKNGYKKSIFQYLFSYLGEKAYNPNNKDGKECYFFQRDRESLANGANIDVRTLDDYNKLLMENKIIYVIKYDEKWKSEDGYSKQVNNIYGLYKDKDTLEEEKEKFIAENKDKLIYSPITSKRKKKEVTPKRDNKQSSTNTSGGFGRRISIVNPALVSKEADENDAVKDTIASENKDLRNIDEANKESIQNVESNECAIEEDEKIKSDTPYVYDWKKSMVPILKAHRINVGGIDNYEVETNKDSSQNHEYKEIDMDEL